MKPTAGSRPSRRPRRKGSGRGRLAVALLGFLLVATGVIWRRSFGIARSRDLQELDRRRVQLEAQRAQLESEVRDLSSRAKLAPIVERRLQMYVPTDSQVIILPHPRKERAPH